MPRQKTFTVAGSWPFPLDMLRYDNCHAATTQDQEKIDHLSGANMPEDNCHTEITLINDRGDPGVPTRGRWASFMWRVL